jgi:hypothetical protein
MEVFALLILDKRVSISDILNDVFKNKSRMLKKTAGLKDSN